MQLTAQRALTRNCAIVSRRWWVDRCAQRSFAFAVSEPNSQLQRVLRRAAVHQVRGHMLPHQTRLHSGHTFAVDATKS